MLYVEIRKKKLRLGEEIFLFLCRVPKKTLGKLAFCRVQKKKHSANKLFAECLFFVECIFFDTRQMACLPSAR